MSRLYPRATLNIIANYTSIGKNRPYRNSLIDFWEIVRKNRRFVLRIFL